MYHSRWKNSHYNAGFSYGDIFYKNKINPMNSITLSAERKVFAQKCISIYQEFYPEALEEIKGIADGLRVDYRDVASFIFSMYCFVFDNKCSCFAFSDSGKTIFGRNSDFAINIEKLCDSALYKLDNAYSFVGNTTAWTEMEDGINEYGLAVGLTFIYPVKFAPGLNAGMLVRYILEKCRTTREAIEALQRLPIASPQTITLADKSGDIAVVECNCEKVVVIKPQAADKFVFTTNHFMSEQMQEYQKHELDVCYSRKRYQTLATALKGCQDYSFDFAKELLSGKKGFLCQYDRREGTDTVWSTIYDLSDEKIYRAEGNPGRKLFKEDKRLVIPK